VAVLTKSPALSGQDLSDTAIEILENALERYDHEEKDFVNMIKVRVYHATRAILRYHHIQALTLSNAGRHDKAICHLSDLLVRSPDDLYKLVIWFR
jgi:tetratricopeptide (TPR) repeat protein